MASAGEDTTELVLRHTVLDDDHWAQFGPGAVGVGWEGALTGLTAFLAGGDRSSNGAQAMAAFMRRSAVLWGEAHEAGGATPAVAREAGRRTSAFYAPAEQPRPP